MRMGIERVRDDPTDIHENYREASLVSRKRWDLVSGQWTRKTKKGPKKEKRTRQRGNFEEAPEYPKP